MQKWFAESPPAGQRMTRKNVLATAGISALMMAMYPELGLAQAGSPPTGERSMAVLEEVVVTARRRQESLQDVPIAITALSEEYLRQHKIDKFDELQYHAPSLTVGQSGTSSNVPVIALRGQRPTEAALHLEAAVPLYFADIVMAPSYGTNISLYDLENVQVLKGPQGTLFGRNSTGGAVLFTPRRPGEVLGGYGQVTAGNYGLLETEIGVDLPVSDRLRFRVAAKTVDRDGYQENVADNPATAGDEYWDENSRALRLSMAADITENLENQLILSWDRNDSAGRQLSIRAVNPEVIFGSVLQADGQRQIATDDPQKVESDLENHFDDVENWFAANTTTWALGDLTLKNIFGYRKVESREASDTDASARNLIQSPPGRPNLNEAEQYSDEFQIQGVAFDERLEWIAGAYLYRMDGTRESVSGIFGFREAETNGDVDNESEALFLQGTYELTDTLSLTAGGRKSWDSREMTVRHRTTIDHPVAGFSETCDVLDTDGQNLPLDACRRTVEDDWSANTWLVSLSYRPNRDTMFYGSIATGYRAGGFNIRGKSIAELQPFDEENVKTYEVGMKSDWDLGGIQLRSNLAIYQQDYSDIQRTTAVEDPVSLTLTTITANAAEATIRGLEYEFDVSPADGLTLAVNYAYVDTEYDDYLDTTFDPPLDRSGESFWWIPEHQVTATLRYTLPLDPSVGEVSLQANYYYQSDLIREAASPDVPDVVENPILEQDGYSLQSYRVDWQSLMGSDLDLALWVKNAADEVYTTGGLTALDSLGIAAYGYGPPRTWGMSLRYSF